MGSGEMMRMANGEIRPGKQDRELAHGAKKIRDEVKLTEFKAQGAAAVTMAIMGHAITVDERRRLLAGDDLSRNMLLAPFQSVGNRQMLEIQMNLFNGWVG